jgi:hypothetical protein
MELREEILLNSGYSDNEIVLTEGIRFFKNSKRLRKLANVILDKVNKTKDPRVNKKELINLVKKIEFVAQKFEKVEIKFASSKDSGEKKDLKSKYKLLRTKYIEILKILRKEEVKKALKVLGLVGAVAGVVVLLLYFLNLNAVGSAVASIANGNSQMPTSIEQLKPILDAAKSGRADAMAKIDRYASGIQAAKKIGGGFFEGIGDWFSERGADITQLFTGSRPVTTSAQKMKAVEDFVNFSTAAKSELEKQVNTGRAIDAAIAGAGGLTVAGGATLINKFFGKLRKNKLVARAKETMSGYAGQGEEMPKSPKTAKVER